jgi:3',5'-nucleoside bisphosphate phosphatase
VHVAYEDVLAAAGPAPDSIGRPAPGPRLVQRGYVATVADAFDRFIGDDGPAFVPTRLINARRGHRADPRRRRRRRLGASAVDLLEPELPRMVEWGLDGVECYRPRNVPTPTGSRTAARHGLLVTGGSDWHGDWHGPLGDFAVERDDVAAFLEVGGI